MRYPLLRYLLFPGLLALAACQGYDITLNEKVVYSPPPLLKDFDVPDPALRQCLDEAIAEDSITAARQLTSLNCSNSGIQSLEGLALFKQLQRLDLSDNRIRNLVELSGMAALRELYLGNNQIIDPVPLKQLPLLRVADLSANAALQCPQSGVLERVESLTLPTHCR